MSERRRNPLERYRDKATPKTAIEAKCFECCGYDRAAVRDCTSPKCPLWPFRPFQEKP